MLQRGSGQSRERMNRAINIILVVDPEVQTVGALVKLLTIAGYNAIGAHSYNDALQVASCMKIDLIICELNMRDRNGVALLAGVRRLYPIRSFAMTAIGSNEEISQSAAAGFDRLFLKPIRFANLHAEIDSMTGDPASAKDRVPA